jgi:hypothetical protein
MNFKDLALPLMQLIPSYLCNKAWVYSFMRQVPFFQLFTEAILHDLGICRTSF